VKSGKPLKNRRIAKSEQVSANRWHLELKVAAPAEIDREFLSWVRHAYELCGDRTKPQV